MWCFRCQRYYFDLCRKRQRIFCPVIDCPAFVVVDTCPGCNLFIDSYEVHNHTTYYGR